MNIEVKKSEHQEEDQPVRFDITYQGSTQILTMSQIQASREYIGGQIEMLKSDYEYTAAIIEAIQKLDTPSDTEQT